MRPLLALSVLVVAASAQGQSSKALSPPAPQVSLSFQGIRPQVEVGPGVPWVFSGLVMHPAAFNHPVDGDFDIAGDEAMHLSLRRARGPRVAVTFERLHRPLKSIALGKEDRVSVKWRLPPEKTKKLSAGIYEARLCVTSSRGTGCSGPVRLTVLESPGKDDAHHLVRDALLRGAHGEASQKIAAILDQRPKDVEALILRAEVLEDQGDLPAAIKAMDEVVKVILDQPGSGGRVPFGLLDYQAQLRRKLAEERR